MINDMYMFCEHTEMIRHFQHFKVHSKWDFTFPLISRKQTQKKCY